MEFPVQGKKVFLVFILKDHQMFPRDVFCCLRDFDREQQLDFVAPPPITTAHTLAPNDVSGARWLLWHSYVCFC